MSVNKVYLTIDDAPSVHMDKKVSFLKCNNIPALFYARGEHLKKHPDQIINAINNGFLIGNHSYTHPYFSEIPIEQCFDEILLTEKLIDECYVSAKKQRPCKIVRLPFADRGAGAKTRAAQDQCEKTKEQEIQNFMRKNNFKSVIFDSPADCFIDSFWDWDTEDYKRKHINNQNLYINNMQSFFDDYSKDSAIILSHDFDNNHHLFEASMKFLLSRNVIFLNYKIIADL